MRSFLSRKTIWLLAALMAFAFSTAFAQTDTAPMAADAHPSFDVATIKLSAPDTRGGENFRMNGRHIRIENATVKNLITFAYAIHDKQIANDPEWLDKDHYDIEGVPDKEGMASLEQYQEMIQKLLATRFGLKFHREKHELSVYAITVAKGGPKLTKSTGGPNAPPEANGDRHPGQQGMVFKNASMGHFALVMQDFFADRPLVDRTGLTGKYDFSLHWTPDNIVATDPNAPPGLFTAVQEQLGLKLEPVKAPIDVLIIDHVDRPSAN
jgi:uncharacterized protein (TIGR03435 family)